MQNTTASDSRSPPRTHGGISPPSNRTAPDSAEPSLTSGFGTVIEKEYDLQTATEDSFGRARGQHALDMNRILRHQHSRLGANIALLEQRYETLPSPERFTHWRECSRPPLKPRHTPRPEAAILPDLIARHTGLRADLEALISCAPDGPQGELILTALSRSHDEMVWMLLALVKEEETAARVAGEPVSDVSGVTTRAQERWDNEGGPARRDPA